jgi:hypothetical protein
MLVIFHFKKKKRVNAQEFMFQSLQCLLNLSLGLQFFLHCMTKMIKMKNKKKIQDKKKEQKFKKL